MSDLHEKLVNILRMAAESDLAAQRAADEETRAKHEELARHYRETARYLRAEIARDDAPD